MFERPQSGERAILVHLGIGEAVREDVRDEFVELARSAGAEPVASISGTRAAPHPRYFVGLGKAEEIRERVAQCDAEVALFNHALKPSQERNLEQLLRCRVLDRAGLILDIFAQRARSHEGKLQVELAQLRHLSTRLVRGWTHLERQKGGIGLRGPGETQLETDRRLLGQRIRMLRRRLGKVSNQREQSRRARRRGDAPTVSLVGYTNAGKSTLFNRLTGATVEVADRLFETLDPTLRRVELSRGGAMVLNDAVGFIQGLPHELIAAFRATLEETRDADLLLHVIDCSDPFRDERREQVNGILEEIGAEQVPQIEVYNKVDLTDGRAGADRASNGELRRVRTSATTGAGIEELVNALGEHFTTKTRTQTVLIDPEDARLRARLYELGAVRSERAAQSGGWEMRIELPERTYRRLGNSEQLRIKGLRAS